MNQILMRLPSELHATIRLSTAGIQDVSSFISICEEIIDSSREKKSSLIMGKTHLNSSFNC